MPVITKAGTLQHREAVEAERTGMRLRSVSCRSLGMLQAAMSKDTMRMSDRKPTNCCVSEVYILLGVEGPKSPGILVVSPLWLITNLRDMLSA